MGRKLLKTVQTIATFRNPLADPVGTRRGPPLVRGPQFENRCCIGLGICRGYLSGARCRLAYGPTDATATHCRVCILFETVVDSTILFL